MEGRDAVWSHPDFLPTADDLDDPDAYVHRKELDLSGLEDLPDEPGDDAGA
jgi:hypothetical protein